MHADDHDPQTCPCCQTLVKEIGHVEDMIRTQSHALAAALQALEKIQDVLNSDPPAGGPTPQIGGGRSYY